MTKPHDLNERPPIYPAEWGAVPDPKWTDRSPLEIELERAQEEIAFLKRIIEALIR